MTDIAELGIKVSPKELEAAVAQLDKLSVAAAKAEVEAKKLERSQTSAAYKAAMAAEAQASAAYRAAQANSTMSAAQRKAAGDLAKQASVATAAARANDLAAGAALQSARAMLQQSDAAQKLVQSNQGAVDSLQNLGAAQDRTARNMGRLAGQQQANMTNIAAQFQDIGVTAAMGMSPLMIGLQQGAQLTGVWGSITGTTTQKLKTFGSAIAAVLSPMSLLIIALTAGIAYLIQWGYEAFNSSSETDKLKKSLDDAKLSTSNFAETQSILGNAFDLTTGKIREQTNATMALAKVQAMQAKIAAQARQQEASKQMKDLSAKKWGIGASFGGGINIEQFYGPTAGVVDTFAKGGYGKNNATKAVSVLESMLNSKMINEEEYLKASQAIVNYAVESENIARSELAMANLESGKLDSSFMKDAPAGRQVRERKPEKTEAEKFAEMMKEADLRIWSLEQEAQAVNLVGEAAKEYAFVTELEAEAKRQSIDLSVADRREQLDLRAAKMASAAQSRENREAYEGEIGALREQNINLEKSIETVRMSTVAAAEAMYAQKLLNDEMFRGIQYSSERKKELKAEYADQLRLNEELKRAQEIYQFQRGAVKSAFSETIMGLKNGEDAWESFGNAAMNVLDQLIDKLLNDLMDALFQVNNSGGGIGGLLGGVGSLLGLSGNGMPSMGQLNSQALETMRSIPVAKPFAKGGAFTNSIVNRPTHFFAKGGAPGVMGEAGPEAIMPLKRGPDGSLGVEMFGGNAQAQQAVAVQIVPSPYFDAVVDDRAAKVAQPMVVQGSAAATRVSEQNTARQSRRKLT